MHVLLLVLVLALVSKTSWGRKIVKFCGEYAGPLAFLTALAALVGSLFYSEVVGYEPCVLCWWQRIFLYPLVPIFGLALWQRTRDAFSYAIPLATLSLIVSAYQVYANLGLGSLLPCTAVGGACSKVYVLAFGYITIPVMSLTISLIILLLAWVKKVYDQDSYAR